MASVGWIESIPGSGQLLLQAASGASSGAISAAVKGVRRVLRAHQSGGPRIAQQEQEPLGRFQKVGLCLHGRDD